jgi:Flp pilus assembly protein TadG
MAWRFSATNLLEHKMFNRLSRLSKDQSGVAALEIAFIMPFLLFLYFGLVDLTAMISLNRKVTYAASVVADLVTQNDSTVTSANIDDYFSAAELVMQPTPMSNIRVEVHQFHSAAGVISSQWSRESATGSSCTAPSTAGMSSLMTDGNDLIVAVLCTTYTPYIATFLGQNILGATTFTMSEQIALRPRQSTTLSCASC